MSVPPGLGAGPGLTSPAVQATLVHDHIWSLRETEFDDWGHSFNRFECACGSVSYT